MTTFRSAPCPAHPDAHPHRTDVQSCHDCGQFPLVRGKQAAGFFYWSTHEKQVTCKFLALEGSEYSVFLADKRQGAAVGSLSSNQPTTPRHDDENSRLLSTPNTRHLPNGALTNSVQNHGTRLEGSATRTSDRSQILVPSSSEACLHIVLHIRHRKGYTNDCTRSRLSSRRIQ